MTRLADAGWGFTARGPGRLLLPVLVGYNDPFGPVSSNASERQRAVGPAQEGDGVDGADVLEYMRHLTRAVFGFDLDEHQRATDRRLLGFLSDHQRGEVAALFGDPPAAVVELLNRPGVRVGGVAAGYQAAV